MQLEKAVEKYGKAGKKAYNRAFKKLFKWFQSEVSRIATAELGIKRSALKGRWFTDLSRGYLWAGLNDLPVHRIARARQNKRGVKVGKEQYDGAFLMNDKLVMMRTTKARLPIEVVTKEIKESLAFAFERVKRMAAARFEKLFEQELNYELNVKR